MAADPPERLSATHAARRCLARVEARDPVVRAFAALNADRILAAAAEIDGRAEPGPLVGMTVAVKDVIDAAGWPTRCNSPICADAAPADRDAASVARLRAAGAVIFGKTVTTEFAYTEPGPTTNPHDATRTPGGSSSGSAAAVADGQADAALTTQTGGSTIRPAAFCGIFGYKPPFGRVPNDGLRLLAPSLDVIGIHARTLSELAAVAAVLEDRPRPLSAPVEPTFALVRLPNQEEAKAYVEEAAEDAARHLGDAGAQVRRIDLPVPFDAVNGAHRVVMSSEMGRTFAADMERHPGLLSESIRGFIELGLTQSDHSIAAARAVLANWKADLAALFGPGEVLVLPAATCEAPKGLASTGSAMFNRPWTALGLAAITVPWGRGPDGLPLGLQIVDPEPLGDMVFPAAQKAATLLNSTAVPVDEKREA